MMPKSSLPAFRLNELPFRVGVRRALLEMAIVLCGLILLWLVIQPIFNPLANAFLVVYELCGVAWGAVRWRLDRKGRSCWWGAFVELLMGGLVFLEIVLSMELLVLFLDRNNAYFPFQYMSLDGLLVSIFVRALAGGMLFIGLRICLRLWVFWDRLRRRYLLWSLTHAHLLVVVICTGTISALVVLLAILRAIDTTWNIVGVVAVIIGMLFFTGVALAVVLPPSALFSFLFSRQLTRRIGKLTAATSSLRAGNYAVRVAVEGEDEIARLQADFNAMAAQLEHTMRELQAERDNVAMLLQARRELIASVSHELRTPVATVRSYLESTLAAWQDRPSPTLHQDLHVMEEQTIRLQSLIDDLFMLARAEVGKLELRCVPVNVALLVQRIVDTTGPIAWRGSRVEVVAELPQGQAELPRVLADERRLEQIVQNLLHNGIRHTPPGGIVVVSARANADAVILQVKDTGEGIAPEEQARIWERFYRTESARKQPGSGTGLGLAIVKELTEAMAGQVAAESVPGQGTCFTIRLPRLPDTPNHKSGQQNSISNSPGHARFSGQPVHRPANPSLSGNL